MIIDGMKFINRLLGFVYSSDEQSFNLVPIRELIKDWRNQATGIPRLQAAPFS
jgi:hypothetical protein